MSVDEPSAYHRPVSLLPDWAANDRRWLGAGLATGVVVYLAYLLTHPYPAYAGGLFLVMAEQISANGYRLPTTIPYYTDTGIPFGYPPLMFYATAIGHDLFDVPLVTLSRIVPGLAVVAYLVPFYAIANDLLGTDRRAGLATVLFAATPTVLRWHLSAGGLVRAPAMLLALTGVYAGLKLFKHGDLRWLVPGILLFGLTVLTHPTYAVFFAMSYGLLFAFFDRSPTGLLAGGAVAAGGLAVAAPWWLAVVAHHGPDIFLTASGTHSGLGGGPRRLVVKLGASLVNLNVESGFFAVAYAGGVYALVRRHYFLPTWAVASSYFIGKNRFMFVAGSMLTAVFLLEYVVPAIQDRATGRSYRRLAAVGSIAIVVTGAAVLGGLYGASALAVAHDHSPSQPQTVDEHDLAAMAWVSQNTAPEDTFAVLGDQGEWLPLYADRTIVLGPWGWEWKLTSGYYDEIDRYDEVAACPDAACLTSRLEEAGREPAYVYVPKDEFVVRGKHHLRDPDLVDSMVSSGRYERVFENPGVVVFSVRDGATFPPADRSQADRSPPRTGVTMGESGGLR